MANGAQPDNVQMRRFSPKEMRELYARAEAVVVPLYPSLRACGMNVINESSQMNCPVIATRTEGLASYIVDGSNGIFVAPGDVQSLREAILGVVGKKSSLQEMTARAHERTAAEAPLERYVSFIYQLLSEPRP
jgi:glycosyltransferase involved in cell wall biosynthesis